jgi:dTDP-4-dehydrorhamnose reductase
MKARAVVTGAAGQLGQAIVEAFRHELDVVALTHADLDVTNDDAVETRLREIRPALIINCASDNDVDAAEEHPVRALEVNAFAVRTLVRMADDIGATLVHYSTDFVFDGTTSRPYVEEDEPNPQSVYAASKLLGEWFAREARRGYVLRVESLFGARPGTATRSSLDKMVASIEAGREVPVFVDRTVSPGYVVDIADATRTLLRVQAPPGLYHCVNSGAATWQAIAIEIARVLGKEPVLRPITLDTVTLRAPRPKYCALSNARLASLGIVMPAWQDALARAIAARRDANENTPAVKPPASREPDRGSGGPPRDTPSDPAS